MKEQSNVSKKYFTFEELIPNPIRKLLQNMPKPDKDRKRTKDIGSLMEVQKKEALKAVTSRRYLNHEQDESDSDVKNPRSR